MKFLFEMFPIILFFAAFKFRGIFFATGVAIAASILQIGYTYFKNKKIEPPMLISLAVILVFGGATLIVHNEIFIKWKPTILYWIFAMVLFTARIVWKKNLMQSMLGKQINVPASVWERLNYSWSAFFALMGGLNLFVAYHFPTNIWVNFKLFGIFGLMIVFVIIQGFMLSPYIKEDAE
ncbi:MAG TPA: septation protein A [Spirochaetota bacterium]|nr:septation protein A [Spirochaetota bacterium]